ncbi:MAG: glycosyltransferase family 2 protein [Candidatus Eremiobacteraeota bacterium]|nr:glycosyltransferase family 2 protein [Candidatus Eremiobacteraeota bacterium]
MTTPPKMRVSVVIPALNEEASIAGVIAELPPGLFKVIVVDNGSTDRTAAHARAAGAVVVSEPQPGYGRACGAGAREAGSETDILVFLDGDGSDCPAVLPQLVEPIERGDFDFVIGSRTRGQREAGSMGPAQLIAGKMCGSIIRALYGVSYSDMCPFRAIRMRVFDALDMRERTYGWNVEMQMRVAHADLRILEIPVPHRRRTGGVSKVSGSAIGTLRASWRILATVLRIAMQTRAGRFNTSREAVDS